MLIASIVSLENLLKLNLRIVNFDSYPELNNLSKLFLSLLHLLIAIGDSLLESVDL